MPGFMIYREVAIMFTMMDESEAAAAIKAVCNYFLDGELPVLEGAAAKLWEYQKAAIDRDKKTYQARVAGGKAGADIRWHREE